MKAISKEAEEETRRDVFCASLRVAIADSEHYLCCLKGVLEVYEEGKINPSMELFLDLADAYSDVMTALPICGLVKEAVAGLIARLETEF